MIRWLEGILFGAILLIMLSWTVFRFAIWITYQVMRWIVGPTGSLG